MDLHRFCFGMKELSQITEMRARECRWLVGGLVFGWVLCMYIFSRGTSRNWRGRGLGQVFIDWIV